MLCNNGLQIISINMCVYLRGGNTFMSQHILDGTKVGATLHEM
jgi:hypothetical protein